MTQKLIALSALFAVGLPMLAPVASSADEVADKGRAVFDKNQHVVVTVEIVLKSKFSMGGMGGQANESRQDVTGTVIDPGGLTVLSLSATDPGQMMQNLMSGMSEEESKVKFETELTDVKILLQDGTELPAEVVLRDKDLDLAFIRPTTRPATPMQALDLGQSGKAQLLDQVVALNRLGNVAGRAYAASVERISAIVQRPRLYYIPESSMTMTTLGAPAFLTDGRVLGLFVMRTQKSQGGGMLSLFNAQRENIAGIIVPAADVLKAAKQAPAEAPPKAGPEKQPNPNNAEKK
jgi:Trypsin-like peptidase domain